MKVFAIFSRPQGLSLGHKNTVRVVLRLVFDFPYYPPTLPWSDRGPSSDRQQLMNSNPPTLLDSTISPVSLFSNIGWYPLNNNRPSGAPN